MRSILTEMAKHIKISIAKKAVFRLAREVAVAHGFDIEKAAELAKLSLSREEKALFSAQIEQTLAFVDTLPNATEHETIDRVATPLREDKALPSFSREELLAGAKQTAQGMIAVPRTVGGEE